MKKIERKIGIFTFKFVLVAGLLIAMAVVGLIGTDSAIAQNNAIAPEIIYYDYIDANGVLKGGIIEVDPTNPKHTVVKGRGPVVLQNGWDVETIIDNGDSNNRVDLVIVGDGYTELVLGDYAIEVANLIVDFFGESPLDEYASFFNVHRVDVVSNESGVDHDPEFPIWRDTELDMGFWCDGMERLLCVDVEKALTAADLAPDRDIVIAMANSEKYGGAGYPDEDIATLAGGNEWATELCLHEFGHGFTNLGDEYWTEDWDYMGGEPAQANLSTYDYDQMKIESAKWYRWLDAETVPTEHGPIDTYEGGGELYETGIYRPTDWSKMRELGEPFHQVNAEQFIFKIYELVDAVDYATPEGTYALGAQFFVEPVQPATHSLDVQWYLDGDAIPGATDTDFDSSTLDKPTGEYTLKVKVVDNTEMVKDETARTNYLTEWREWTLGEAAHWKLDETEGTTAYDSIGDNDGALVGDTHWVAGKIEGALEFDGDEDYVEVSNPDDSNFGDSTDFTFSAWIKAETTQLTYPAIIGRRNASPYNGYIFRLWSDGKLAVQLNDGTPTNYVSTSGDLCDSTWHHVAATGDRDGNLTFYVDGEQKGQPDISGKGDIDSTSNLFIGWEERDPTNSYFNGTIDDVRVYAWKVGQAEIWEIMSAGASKFCVKDNYRVNMAWFDDSGNLFLKGEKLEDAADPIPPDSFIITDSEDVPVAYIDSQGNLWIAGDISYGGCNPQGDAFIIKNSSDTIVSYIDFTNGDLCLTGKLYQNPE